MNEQEIRKALNAIPAGAKIPKEYCEAVNILLDLAQAYLSTPEGWPKKEKVKRICKHGYKIHLGCTQWNDEDISDFNRAIDLCLLARLKEKAEFEKKLDMLEDVIKDDVSQCLLVGYEHFGNELNKRSREIATAIRGYLGGDEK